MADILGGAGSLIVYVDDSDQNIQYGDGWTVAENNPIDGYGFPLYGTLHEASVTTDFSFAYSGTNAMVFLIDKAGTDYTCALDGRTLLDMRPPASGTLNPLASCSGYTKIDGQHELKVTVFGNQSNPVFLDYIAYNPSSNVTSADFAYFPGDPLITLGSADPNTFALFPNSTLDFVFYGYSVTLRGFFDNEAYSHTPSPASYTVDGGEPVNFTIINTATNSTPLLTNQVLLQTPIYPLGQHTLHVDFLGTNQTSPLATNDIIVQNQTSHITLTPTPQPQIPLPSSTTHANQSRHAGINHHIVMVAIIIGSLVIVISLSILAFVLWRRRVKRRGHTSLDLFASPSTTDYPFVPIRQPETRTDIKNNAPTSRPPDIILVHVDSGNRISQPNALPNVVELPPTYDTINGSTY